jgi:LCP family protein required for cell wall assembly
MLHRFEGTVGRRSPFAAAFLSFLFPGLGQAYVGFAARALAFAAPPLLALALLAGILINKSTRDGLLANLTSPSVLLVVLGLNLGLLVYRALAVVDAFRAAAIVTGHVETDSTRLGRPRLRLHPLSIVGLGAVLVVLSVGHVAAARLNLAAYDAITGISDPNARPSLAPASGSPVGTPRPTGTVAPTSQLPPWDGKERLNLLLIGSDTRPEIAGHHFTDTLIVASIDPATKQVAMFSLPRDTIRVPLPPSFPASDFFAGGVYPEKINGLFLRALAEPQLFPGNDRQRGYEALKGALGELYGIDIRYYIEVDFTGFKQIVDRMGGVVIDVQAPVSDDGYPIDDDRKINLYIPPGIQHMDGERALAYARARHKSDDFDRALRQQRVLLSLRQQADIPALLAPGRLESLVEAVKQAVHTDIPPELFPQLVSLAQSADLNNLRSIVFTPPVYQVECLTCYSLTPKIAVIRRAVREAFTFDPAFETQRAKLAEEAAAVWVLNGSGRSGQAGRTADYLAYLGMDAVVPRSNGGRADRTTYTSTVVTFYNGAEADLPETVRVLEATFDVKVATKRDPNVSVDVIVITGSRTPVLEVPD